MNRRQERAPDANRTGTILGLTITFVLLGLALAAGARTAGPSTGSEQAGSAAAEATAASLRHRRIRLSTGVELHVAEVGPPTGIPVVFLHGYTDSWFSWSRLMEHFPTGMRAIMPTQRGHGDSERPECCYNIADFAADVNALLEALEIGRAHVVGHSMGGVIAQRVAIAFPERVDRLVIMSSAADLRNDAVVGFNELVQQLTDPLDPAFIREFQESTAAASLPEQFLDAVVSESAKLPARIWRDVLGGLVSAGAAHDVARIDAPTLILWGEQDTFIRRADQDHLAQNIRRSRLLTYAGSGHAPNWEIPDVLARDLWQFLDLEP